MKAIGYTELQADRLMGRIDAQAAKVCDELVRLQRLVPDTHDDRTSYLQGQVHSAAMELKEVVRRRKRR